MKVLITGAAGYLGARLYVDLRGKHDVLGTYNSSRLFPDFVRMDVTNDREVSDVFLKFRPEAVIHAAASPSAKWCEKNPEAAYQLNVNGTFRTVNAANRGGARFVYVSTYAAMKPDPSDVYGSTKLAGEYHARRTKAGYVILRPSMIFGFSPNTKNDRPFNRILRNLDGGTPAVYDSSWKFQPTWIGHISEVIEIIMKRGIMNETIPVAVSEVKTRYDIARDILAHFGVDAEPKDEGSTRVATADLRILERLGLPQYGYEEIIEKIVDEIKQRERLLKGVIS